MAKIMEIVAKETKGKSYHTYKYSYDSVVLALSDKANADGWDDTAYLPYSTAKAGTVDAKLDTLAVAAVQDYMVEAENEWLLNW